MKEKHKRFLDLILKTSDPIEKGRLLKTLKDDDIRVTDLSEWTGFTISHIANLIRLCRLPELILDGYYAESIKYTHLLLLSRLKTKEDMIEIYDKILAEETTTSELDDIIRDKLFKVKPNGERVDDETLELIQKGFKKLHKGVSTKIIQTKVRARLVIDLKGDNTKTSEFLTKLADLLSSD